MIRTILLHNLSSRLLRNSRFCFYGKTLLREKVTVLNSIRQGGLLNIEAIKPAIAKITISSAWQDHCELEFPDDAEGYINIAEDSQEGSALIELSEAFKDFELKLKVPEHIDIALNSSALDLIMKNKIQGDCVIDCKSGSIVIDKLRGDNVIIQAGKATVESTKSLEGNVRVVATSFTGKMVHTQTCSLEIEQDITIKALYSDKCTVSCGGSFTVGLMDGVTQAICGGSSSSTKSDSINIRGVSGVVDLVACEGDVVFQINNLRKGGINHSSIRALNGSIRGTLDPEINALIECRSMKGVPTFDSDAFTKTDESLLADHEWIEFVKSVDGVDDQPSSSSSYSYTGILSGKSESVKRPNFLSKNATSGKIDLEAADKQSSWRDYGKNNPPSYDDDRVAALDSLQCYATGLVELQTRSWIQAIRSKYGFQDKQ